MSIRKVEQAPGTEPGFFYGYFIVMAASIMMIVMWAVYYAFGIFFKPMLTEFAWTRAMTSGAFSLSSMLNGLLAIAMGGLTDRFGPRMVMTVCGLLLGLGYLLMSQVTAIWHLYLFWGVIVGIGMGGSFVPLMSTIARWFLEKRSLMTGIVTAGIGIGAMTGPPAASRLISSYGWRTSYVILGCLVLAGVIISAQFIKRDPAQLGQLAYGENEAHRKNPETWVEALSLRESLHTRQFWVVFCMYFCLGFCAFAIMVHLAPHATELDISAVTAANILATVGALSIVGRIVMGRAADIIGSRQAFMIGFALMSAALFWLIPARMLWVLYSTAGVFGFAYGTCVSSQSPLVAVLFGLRAHGLILGVLSFSFTIGGAVGPLLTGHIFDMTSTYQLAFSVCTAVSCFGLILSIILKSLRPPEAT